MSPSYRVPGPFHPISGAAFRGRSIRDAHAEFRPVAHALVRRSTVIRTVPAGVLIRSRRDRIRAHRSRRQSATTLASNAPTGPALASPVAEPISSSKKGRTGAADRPDVRMPPAASPAPDTSSAAVDHRGIASRDRDSDHARPSAGADGRVHPEAAGRARQGVPAGLRRPAGRAPPPHVPGRHSRPPGLCDR